MSGLHGRGAVVTGAGRGIGEAVAMALAGAGVRVVLAARSVDQLASVADAISASGGEAHVVACDVTDERSVASLAAAARSRLGEVHILVNNAGIALSAKLENTSLADWNRVLAVNATGTFLCMRAFLPAMIEQEWGRIVNVASVAGLAGSRYIGAYAASKHAVIGLTRAVAQDVAGSGVTVNAVCPAFVDTPMTEQTVANVAARTGSSREEALAMVLSSAQQPRLVTPAEVAAAVLSLCDVSAAAINGEARILDGGDMIDGGDITT
jgi:3-hydroxybutyrate dehydrogenase